MKVASINLCADILAYHLLPPSQLESLSFLAADEELSPISTQVKDNNIPLNRGRVDELLLSQVDIVMVSEFTPQYTLSLLKQLNIKVVKVNAVYSVEQVLQQILDIGEQLGQSETAKKLHQSMLNELNNHQLDKENKPAALILQANGYTSGENSLSHDLMSRAGVDNAAAYLNYAVSGQLSLEDIMLSKADFFVFQQRSLENDMAHAYLNHRLFDKVDKKTQYISFKHWMCGGPQNLTAVQLLKQASADE